MSKAEEFRELFNTCYTPEDVLFNIVELKAEYLELSLYAQKGFQVKDSDEERDYAHKGVHDHAYHLDCIIDLLKKFTT